MLQLLRYTTCGQPICRHMPTCGYTNDDTWLGVLALPVLARYVLYSTSDDGEHGAGRHHRPGQGLILSTTFTPRVGEGQERCAMEFIPEYSSQSQYPKIEKICGSWRVWVEGEYRGNFSKDVASRVRSYLAEIGVWRWVGIDDMAIIVAEIEDR